jgi:hypothetical protein
MTSLAQLKTTPWNMGNPELQFAQLMKKQTPTSTESRGRSPSADVSASAVCQSSTVPWGVGPFPGVYRHSSTRWFSEESAVRADCTSTNRSWSPSLSAAPANFSSSRTPWWRNYNNEDDVILHLLYMLLF